MNAYGIWDGPELPSKPCNDNKTNFSFLGGVFSRHSTRLLARYKDLTMIAGGSAVTVAIQICEDAPWSVAIGTKLSNRFPSGENYRIAN